MRLESNFADAFYTPTDVAGNLVSDLPQRQYNIVADFACGGGSLLTAFEQNHTAGTLVATDISPTVICCLKKQKPHWKSGKVNMLSQNSRNASPVLRSVAEKVDLVLLNPPYSNKGGAFERIQVDGKSIKCSRSASFVGESINYLSPNGIVRAILPESTLTSVLDELFWKTLSHRHQIFIRNSYPASTFNGCSAKTIAIEIRKTELSSSLVESDLTKIKCNLKKCVEGTTVSLFRGRLNIVSDQKQNSGIQIIHTTDLNDFSIQSKSGYVNKCIQPCARWLVTIPRVGMPKLGKIVILDARERYALSSCLLAVCCNSHKTAKALSFHIRSQWNQFRRIYRGTGAPYTTLKVLREALSQLGYEVSESTAVEKISASSRLTGSEFTKPVKNS